MNRKVLDYIKMVIRIIVLKGISITHVLH